MATAATQIPIERLTPDTIVYRADNDLFGPFGWFAEVQGIEFNGDNYVVTGRLFDEAGCAGGDEFEFIVDAGQSIQFGGMGQPTLRSKADVPAEEWEAKGQALKATTDAILAQLAPAHAETARVWNDVYPGANLMAAE